MNIKKVDDKPMVIRTKEKPKVHVTHLEQFRYDLIACTGCGQIMSFEEGDAYIYSHIQEERLRFIYSCGARNVLFEQVLALVE